MMKYYIRKSMFLLLFISIYIQVANLLTISVVNFFQFEHDYYISFISKLLFFIITIYILKREPFINFKMVFKKLFLSIFIILLLVYFSLKSTLTEINNLNLNINNFQLIGYFIKNLTTGFVEEFFIRLLLFGYICYAFYKKSLFFKVLLTSLIFGLIHISNFIAGKMDIYSVLTQIKFAFVIGVLFQIIFLRTKNILLISVLHGLVNFFGMKHQILYKTEKLLTENYSLSESYISSLFTMFVFAIVVIPLAYFYLKHAKNEIIIISGNYGKHE